MEWSNFRKRLSGEEFDKAGSDGRLYVFKKYKSDKDTRHIQKVQKGGKDYEKKLDIVPYSGVATGNDNSGGDKTPNESKEHRASKGKGGHTGSRFDLGAYRPN